MIKFISAIVVLMVVLFASGEVKASHIIGGNLTYRHLSGDTFMIRLTLRRDCFLGDVDAQFDNPANVWVFTSGGAQATWLPSRGVLQMPFMASDTLNEYIQSDCGYEGKQVCVHETTYEQKLVLPYRVGGYILTYQRCCRNESINNIVDPRNTGASFTVNISEESLRNKNSSPVFKNWPDVYICANKNLNFDHSATDRDGDSLAYKLCVPNSGATRQDPKPALADPPPYDFVSWQAPYDLTNLMGGTPLKIDAKTGEITANPNLVGQFLIGVCVEEYRNKKLIGTVRREFQYNVRICSQPPLAQFTTSESKCEGLTLSFFNNSLSTQNFQWNFNYPSTDPAFKSNVKDPIFTYPSSGVYKVLLRATRGSDGCFDTLIQTVSVFTNKIVPNFNYSINSCNEAKDSLTLTVNDLSTFDEPGYSLNNWQWKITQNGVITNFTGKSTQIPIATNGLVKIESTLFGSNGCISTKEYTVDPQSLIPAADFTFAVGGCPTDGKVSVQLSNISGPLNPLGTITNTSWDVNGVVGSGGNTTVDIPQSSSSVIIKLITTLGQSCKVETIKEFSLQPLIPNADVNLEAVACPTDKDVTVKLKYLDNNAVGVATTSLQWTALSSGVSTNLSGQDASVTIPKDSLIKYTLIARYANGCVDTVSKSIVPGPFAQIFFATDSLILCAGQDKSFVLNPNPAWTYNWSPTNGLDLTDPSNPIVSVETKTTYTVTVSDGLCSVNGQIVVIPLSKGVDLNIVGDTISCDGTISLEAFGGIGQGTYTWGIDPNINAVIGSGNTLETNFTGLSQTFYVSFVGESCATRPAQLKIRNERPRIEDSSPFILCKSDTAKLLVVNLVPQHQNSIIWDNDSHIVSGSGTFTPTIGLAANEMGPVTLFYNVTNQYNCKIRDTFTINIGQNPIVNYDFNVEKCGERKVCFDLMGSYNGFIRWNFGDPLTQNDISPIGDTCYTYLQPGTFTATIENLIDVCPFLPVAKTFVINPPLDVAAGDDLVLCLNDKLTLTATSNVADVKYVWTNLGNQVLSNSASYSQDLNTPIILVVGIEDVYGCKATDTVSAKPFVFDYNVAFPDSLCINEDGKIKLNIANPSAYTYQWLPSTGIVSGANTTEPTVKATAGAEFSVIVKNTQYGCLDTTNVKPKISAPFDFDLELPEVYCKGQDVNISLKINKPEDYDYLWTPAECFVGSNTVANPIISITNDKNIKLLITKKSSGCKEDMTFLAEAGDDLTINVDADPDFTIYEGKEIELFVVDSNNMKSYVWSTGATSASIIVNPSVNTSYTVTVTDQNGCTGTDIVEVEVRNAKCDESDVYIPNAFSPNGDGTNDILYVRSNFIEELEMIVYNRWGQEVFRTNDPSQGWDGRFNNQELPPDAFAYYIRALCVNGKTYTKKGNVSLIR